MEACQDPRSDHDAGCGEGQCGGAAEAKPTTGGKRKSGTRAKGEEAACGAEAKTDGGGKADAKATDAKATDAKAAQ